MDFRKNSLSKPVEKDDADPANEPYLHPYQSLLHEPTVALIGNPSDRADVATAAILGYN
ncbi:conserved hypothetical protein [Paraburkholderia unamae]|nr:hypothetical protein C7401_11646 [Paraburkholderia unamae]CAG9243269.1 conserved hypothetical protein [Paraburkholderia unamae]